MHTATPAVDTGESRHPGDRRHEYAATSLADIRRRAQKHFPVDSLQEARDALCLFAATTGGRTDLIHLFDAGLRDVVVVDDRSEKLESIRAAFPPHWTYLEVDGLTCCRNFLIQGRSFDVVLADGSSGIVDHLWEYLLPYAGALARQTLLLRLDQRLLDDYEVPATEEGVRDLGRRLHGIEIDVRSVVRRSRSQGGTYWAVIASASHSGGGEGWPCFAAAWKRPQRAATKSKSPPHGHEHCVEIHDRLGAPSCPDGPQCRSAINSFRQQLYLKEQQSIFRAYTSERFAMLPRRRVDEFENAAGCFDLDRFETIDDVLEAARVATSKRGTVNRKVSRAKRLGYVVKPFDRRLFVPDLHAVNTSMAVRGGKPMASDYRLSIEEMGGPPTQRYEVQSPACPQHFNMMYGVFLHKPGHRQGDIVTDERLVGYIHLYRYGNHCRYSRILGHGDHLQNGVMYLLHFALVEELLKLKDTGLRYIFYTGMFSRGRDGSLEKWKRRCLFEPKFMIYNEAGDWRGPPGMTMLPLYDGHVPVRDPDNEHVPKPRKIALKLSSGEQFVHDLDDRPDLQARVACAIESLALRTSPYEYAVPESRRRNFTVVLRHAQIQRAARAVFQPDLPRILITTDRLRPPPLQGTEPSTERSVAPAPKLIPALASRANIIYFPKGLRNSRKVCQHLYDLVSCRPDIMVLGIALEDWLLDPATGQTQIDLDETLYRLEWVMTTAKRDFGVRSLLVLDLPVGPEGDPAAAATADVFAQPLLALAQEQDAAVVDLRPIWSMTRRPAPFHRADAALRSVVEALEGMLGEPRSSIPTDDSDGARQYQLAQKAEVTMVRPERHRMSSTVENRTGEQRVTITGSRAQALHLALTMSTEIEGDDEGSAEFGKLLHLLGGRDEFERTRQKQIVDWLAGCERPNLKRVMIIGDSIRMRIADATGYGIHAYRRLVGRANLTHVPHNCGGTKVALFFLENWLTCRPEVVHINAGLHNLAVGLHGREAPAFTPPELYAQHLEAIINQIRAAGCERIIWGLNTPVQEDWHRAVPGTGKPRSITRYNSDVRLYNDVSIDVMRRLNVPVTDMFTPLWDEGMERVLVADGVHLNHRGSAILGERVAAAVLKHL